MKRTMLFFFSLLLVAATGFAENLVLDNQTSYPTKDQKTKMMIQWAFSAKDVDDGNHAIAHGSALNPKSLQAIKQPGKVKLVIPKKAEYFRILVWSTEQKEPDLHTNWVEIIPNKTYLLKPDQLVPSVLMSGMGC